MFELTKNCRNTPNIQREMNRIAGVHYETLKKNNEMPEVKYIQFDTQEEEAELLENEIKNLLAGGIKKNDITLLSPFKREKSVVPLIKKYDIDGIGTENDNVTYSTIQGFKGLENSIIILTDIQTYNKPDLMYVAMSRARSMLIILETKNAEKYRKKLD